MELPKEPKIVLEFATLELAEEWYGWYLDGGGEDAYADAMSCRGMPSCHVRGYVNPDFNVITHTPIE